MTEFPAELSISAMFVFKTIVWGTVFSFVALIAGPWFAMQFDSSFPVLDFGVFRYFGIVIIAAGIPFSLYCAVLLFIPAAGRPMPYDTGDKFIIEGPYRYVRNPFLLGVIVTLIGETILMSRIAMFGYTFMFVWCVHFWVIFFEEPALLELFRDDYEDYMNAVPRWFPKLKRYG